MGSILGKTFGKQLQTRNWVDGPLYMAKIFT